MTHTRTRFVTRSGISVERRGAGRPVVLVHGWCLNGGLWTYHAEALADRFDVVVPDLPGFGRSDDLAGPYDLPRYARELGALLEELRLDGAVLVGFAFGAAVAMALAAQDDTRLAGLVLIGVPSAEHAAYDRMPRAMRRDWPLFAERSATAICKHPLSDPTKGWLARMFGSTPLPVAIETCGLLGEFTPEPVAKDVTVPALLVHGADDAIVPVEVSRACAELMANGRLAVVEDCGHLVVLDQKDQLTELVAGFAAELT